MEASGNFLDEGLLVCNIAQDKMPYVTLDAILLCSYHRGRGWDDLDSRMGLVESIVGQEGPLMADPCSEEQMTSNNKISMTLARTTSLNFKIKQNGMTTG
jgi:hypothetical protein